MTTAQALTGFIRTSFSLAFDLRSYRAGWRALRAPSLVIAGVSCALGVVLAFQAGKGDWINAAAVMVAGLALQAGVNLVNDFFEFMQGKVNDKAENLGFSRSDRLTLEWLVFLVGLAFFGLAGLVGLFIAWRTGWPVLVLGVVGFLGGFFYTGEPLNYKRRGLAVPIVFFLMGVIMISGSYYAVARDFSWSIVLISVPVSFLVSLILLTNELRDFEADIRYGMRTMTVRIRYPRAVLVYCLLLVLAYATPVLLAREGLFRICGTCTLRFRSGSPVPPDGAALPEAPHDRARRHAPPPGIRHVFLSLVLRVRAGVKFGYREISIY